MSGTITITAAYGNNNFIPNCRFVASNYKIGFYYIHEQSSVYDGSISLVDVNYIAIYSGIPRNMTSMFSNATITSVDANLSYDGYDSVELVEIE